LHEDVSRKLASPRVPESVRSARIGRAARSQCRLNQNPCGLGFARRAAPPDQPEILPARSGGIIIMDESCIPGAGDRSGVENVHRGGGPVTAVVVKAGIVIATGVNQVTCANGPTAHAEIVAIREACRVLGDFQLSGCELYSSCEPCPMSSARSIGARPARIFFAATKADTAQVGFDDAFIYEQLDLPYSERTIPIVHVSK